MAGKAMDEGRLKKVIDPRLIKALGHPLREHLLATLNERIASPREMADEIGLDLTDVSYHVRVLRDCESIELVETGQRRGAIEHFYRARETFSFDDREWKQLPASLKANVLANLIQLIMNDAIGALKAGAFDALDARHVSWTPSLFDLQGWRELIELLDATLDRVNAIRDKCAERIAKTGEPGIPATVALVGFGTSS